MSHYQRRLQQMHEIPKGMHIYLYTTTLQLKGNIPITQHERQLDFKVQSPGFASRNWQSPEKPPSPPSTDGVCDSEKGNEQEQLLPGLPVESQPGFFDVSSFLDTFGPNRGDQDEIFPFFSPSETLLSPAPRQGDEPSYHFSLQDVAVSGIENASLHNCTLVPPPAASSHPCRCLAAAALAVEEFETSCNHGNRAELDSIISRQKKAIRCCRSMITCISCTAKRENIVLLIFITEKIVAVCSQVVLLYNTGDSAIETRALLRPSTDTMSSRDTDFQQRSWGLDIHDSSSAPQSLGSPAATSLPCWRELLVGDYEVSSQLEWEHLMRVLISIQLRAVMDLLANTRRLKSDVLTEVQAASLARSQTSIAKLGSRISALY
jgi:hypothetical protein